MAYTTWIGGCMLTEGKLHSPLTSFSENTRTSSTLVDFSCRTCWTSAREPIMSDAQTRSSEFVNSQEHKARLLKIETSMSRRELNNSKNTCSSPHGKTIPQGSTTSNLRKLTSKSKNSLRLKIPSNGFASTLSNNDIFTKQNIPPTKYPDESIKSIESLLQFPTAWETSRSTLGGDIPESTNVYKLDVDHGQVGTMKISTRPNFVNDYNSIYEKGIHSIEERNDVNVVKNRCDANMFDVAKETVQGNVHAKDVRCNSHFMPAFNRTVHEEQYLNESRSHIEKYSNETRSRVDKRSKNVIQRGRCYNRRNDLRESADFWKSKASFQGQIQTKPVTLYGMSQVFDDAEIQRRFMLPNVVRNRKIMLCRRFLLANQNMNFSRASYGSVISLLKAH